MADNNLKIRALRTFQGENAVYSFFISGQDIFRIADIQRISRGENAELKAFKKDDPKSHCGDC